MHDIRAIRDNPELYEKAWAAKGSSGRVAEILELDAKLRAAQTAGQAAQAERNDASKRIGQAKAQKDEAEAQRLMAAVEALKGALGGACRDRTRRRRGPARPHRQPAQCAGARRAAGR
jgi:seryl-tRNA synthetase